MPSQSKPRDTQPAPDRQVGLVFENEPQDVERLEFASVEDPEAHGKRADLAATLRSEVAALEDQLRHQAEVLPGKIEDARKLARLLARNDWEMELQQHLAEDRSRVLRACQDFERERTRYFAAVEAQVVKLALAIAARVLNREAKMDPMLLSAAVRVALEKVKDESGTKLRVPVSEVALWRAVFDTAGEPSVHVVGDESMARNECVLETSVGTVELGIQAQLNEIERGFFDLMQKRPA